MLFRPGAGGRQRGEAPARSGGHGAQKKQGASRGGDALPCACMRHPCLEGHFVHVGSLGGEGGAQVIVLAEAAPILLSQWDKAGRYPVTLAPLPLDQLTPTPGECKEVRATVASPRLDAVLAAGFSIPRSRAADLIRGGRVQVNHRPCDKADKPVAEGDTLTCRGLGKCVLRTLGGTSKRGRTILLLDRYG